MVDWFVDLRSTLSAFDRLFGYNPIKVVGITRSTKWAGQISSHCTYREASSGGEIVSFPAYRSDVKGYERSILKRSINFRPKIRFGKSQMAISVALLTQLLQGIKNPGRLTRFGR